MFLGRMCCHLRRALWDQRGRDRRVFNRLFVKGSESVSIRGRDREDEAGGGNLGPLSIGDDNSDIDMELSGYTHRHELPEAVRLQSLSKVRHVIDKDGPGVPSLEYPWS